MAFELTAKFINFLFENPDKVDQGIKTTNTSSSLIETATDKKVINQSKTLKTLNKVAKKGASATAIISVIKDASETDFDNPSDVGDFVENTVQTTVGATPLVGPGLDVIMEDSKKEDGVTNVDNMARNFSTVYDRQQKATQERINRLKNLRKKDNDN